MRFLWHLHRPTLDFPHYAIKFFYHHSDSHILHARFVQDLYWHFGVNTTREIVKIPVEARRIVSHLEAFGSCTTETNTKDTTVHKVLGLNFCVAILLLLLLLLLQYYLCRNRALG